MEYYFEDFQFDFTANLSNNFSSKSRSKYYFDIALSAHFVHDETVKSQQFKDFTKAFPKWENVQNWTKWYYAAYKDR